jgi:hypothetical protein
MDFLAPASGRDMLVAPPLLERSPDMAKKVFYVCAGLFLLALTCQVGAREATVQASSNAVVAVDSTVQAPAEAGTPAPARTHIRAGDRVYIEPSDFGMALSAAILKKKVPVTVTTDSTKADFYVRTTSEEHRAGGAEKVARIAFGVFGSGNTFKATTTVMNKDGDVVFAYNSKKENFQSAAQNIAKNLNKHIKENADLP